MSVLTRSTLSTIGLSLQAILLFTGGHCTHVIYLFCCLYQVCQRTLLYRWRCCCSSFTLQRYGNFSCQQNILARFLLLCMYVSDIEAEKFHLLPVFLCIPPSSEPNSPPGTEAVYPSNVRTWYIYSRLFCGLFSPCTLKSWKAFECFLLDLWGR